MKKTGSSIIMLGIIAGVLAGCGGESANSISHTLVAEELENEAEQQVTENIESEEIEAEMSESEGEKSEMSESEMPEPEETVAEAPKAETAESETVLEEDISDDYYAVATSKAASETEQFALDIKKDILDANWTTLSEKMVYPITISGETYESSKDFQDADISSRINKKFKDAIEAESCHKMFCNWQGISMGDAGQIWIADVDNGNGEFVLKIIAINGMFD